MSNSKYSEIIRKYKVLKSLNIDESEIINHLPEYQEIKHLKNKGLNNHDIQKALDPLHNATIVKDSSVPKIYLGLDLKNSEACIIKKISDFEIKYYNDNPYEGHDKIEDVLKNHNWKFIGDLIELREPISYNVYQREMGFHIDFNTTITHVREVTSIQ